MNVYDFDNTILRGDTTFRFTRWCIVRHPSVLRVLPGFLSAFRKWRRGALTITEGKSAMLGYFRYLPDIDAEVERFWRANRKHIKPWYLKQMQKDDVIISASPEFLVRPACEAIGVTRVHGTIVDKRSGRILGENCSKNAKVMRFRQIYGDAQIDCFYSDSHSDDPLARIAKRAYFVKGDKLSAWRFRETR